MTPQDTTDTTAAPAPDAPTQTPMPDPQPHCTGDLASRLLASARWQQ